MVRARRFPGIVIELSPSHIFNLRSMSRDVEIFANSERAHRGSSIDERTCDPQS